jgi:hypothetical protein
MRPPRENMRAGKKYLFTKTAPVIARKIVFEVRNN